MRLSPRQSMKLLKSKKTGNVLGILMLLIGLGAFAHVVKITIDERAMRDWVPHLASVQSAGLATHTNDKGGETYTIDVSYLFEWEGSSFKGTRYRLHDQVSPDFEKTNEIVQGLLVSKQDGGQYPIFVNPKNPLQSAVINSVHPKAKSGSLFLGFLFSLIGYFTVFKPRIFKKRSET